MANKHGNEDKRNQKLMILNVDPGIDDAQAILMVLADPNVKILGVCIHHGNTCIENTTKNTLKLLSAINRTDVPVFVGCKRALVFQPDSGDNYFGEDGLGDYEDLPDPDHELVQQEHAVLAMLRLVREYPGQITLVALGPLTNLAMAHRLEPEFSKQLKDCFIMGGNYKAIGNITPCAEFNFYFDVEAAHVVLSEFICKIYVFTWELCLESGMPWEVNASLRAMSGIKASLMKNLEAKLIKRWKLREKYVICDELAVAAALDGQCMAKWEDVSVDVECHGLLTRGEMIVDWRGKTKKPRKIRLVTKMDMELVKTILQRAYLE